MFPRSPPLPTGVLDKPQVGTFQGRGACARYRKHEGGRRVLAAILGGGRSSCREAKGAHLASWPTPSPCSLTCMPKVEA